MIGTPAAKVLFASAIGVGADMVRVLRLNADGDYLQKKFLAFRTQTCLIIIVTALMGASAWGIDHDIDPSAAGHLVWARLGYLLLLLPAWAIWRGSSHHRAALLALLSLALAQFLEIAILRRLDGGVSIAVMSVAFYPVAAMLLCMGFSLFVNWAALLLVTLSPLLMMSTGWLRDFPYHLYKLIIWPDSVFLALICVAFAVGYHRRYLLECALEDASNTDPLTGVANRRHFQLLLQRETSRFLRLAQPCSLLMVDIDFFKRINDTYGHPAGDLVIKALADVCTDNSREVDVVARLGGEEFAVLVTGTGIDGALQLAERIRAQAEGLRMSSGAGQEMRWTISVGIADLRSVAGDLAPAAMGDRLMAHADAALYEAKNAGRNRVVAYAAHGS